MVDKEHHHHHHHHNHHDDGVKEDKKKDKTEKKERKHKRKEIGSDEEIEIDVHGDVPLSKKEKRLLKKGKISADKLQAKKKRRTGESRRPADGSAPGLLNTSKRTDYGVWIGNLSYQTTKEDLVSFLVAKTKDLGDETGKGEKVGEAEKVDDEDEPIDDGSSLSPIKESDILRINLPGPKLRCKGYAYIDFATPGEMRAAISLSEMDLNGRNILVKNSKSYEGRPAFPVSRNPPSRILFVGNLPFDTTEAQLTEHFKHCGEITRVRMATFEDTGKCKGFAFLDFTDEEGPTAALQDKACQKMVNRPLRMEFGEDRSKRKVRSGDHERPERFSRERPSSGPDRSDAPPQREFTEKPVERSFERPFERPVERTRPEASRRNDYAPNRRLKSSIALATAQRENPAVKASGKKTTFD